MTALPPGPDALPIHQLLRWLRNPYPLLDELREKHGETFTLRLGVMPPMVMLSNPEHIKEVFAASGDDMYAGKLAETLKPFLGARSLLLLDGAEHRAMRRLTLPPFHGERMHAYGDQMLAIAHDAIDAMPLGTPFAIHGPMQSITLEIILRTVFGLEDPARRARMHAHLTELLEIGTWPPLLLPVFQRDLGPWSPWGRFLRRMQQGEKDFVALIEERRGAPPGASDILSLLLAARDEDGNALGEQDLRDQLVTLLVAGHETTATGLSWAMRWLLASPKAESALRDEVATAEREGPLTPDRIAKLEFLDAVVRESLRLQPIVPLVGRVLQRPMRVGGMDLPAGVAVACSIYLAHRREGVWKDPERFDPWRFLEKRYSPSEWLPFGGGVRKCLGMAFALYEMKIVLAALYSRCEFRFASDKPIRAVRRAITMAPSKGVPVVLESRVLRARA
ncbi:MAG: cytochrome P450 [Polyangiales bacterium]